MVAILDATGVVQVRRGALIMDTCPVLAGFCSKLIQGDAEFDVVCLETLRS